MPTELAAGDIAVAVGFKNVLTGATLGSDHIEISRSCPCCVA